MFTKVFVAWDKIMDKITRDREELVQGEIGSWLFF